VKIVINACFGGIGLSWAAMQMLAERKGLVASYFPLSRDIYTRVYGEDAVIDPDGMGVHRVIGPTAITDYPEGPNAGAFISHNDVRRDDPDLVAVVEKLGARASGEVAKLKVVEIPDGIEWEIEEYDGSESIAEVHRTWS